MNHQLIGRKKESEILDRLYESRKSEFLVIYGRRRVGKTFLITKHYEGKTSFQLTGLANSTTKRQLTNFSTALNAASGQEVIQNDLPDWFEAFQYLAKFLELLPQAKKLIFLDELPWLDTHGSQFISALEHFWNSWASLRTDILLIGCGSAASWIINKLIRNKGGLHNRITERIRIEPFNLNETEEFLKSKGTSYDRYQILELYMAMGGIPFYLEQVMTNRSIAQNIDRLYFQPGSSMQLEYENVFRSLFKNYKRHFAVVEYLSTKTYGIERKDIINNTSLNEGGSGSTILDELELSGFVSKTFPFGKTKRNAIYKLIDPYTLFFLKFVKNSRAMGEGSWLSRINNAQWQSWSGIAFENICHLHHKQIKKALGISGIYSEVSEWRAKSKKSKAQIDMIIDRNDRVINLCEIKFSTSKYLLSKAITEKLQHKLRVFQTETGTKKTLFLTMITTFGLKENQYASVNIHNSVSMNDLFE